MSDKAAPGLLKRVLTDLRLLKKNKKTFKFISITTTDTSIQCLISETFYFSMAEDLRLLTELYNSSKLDLKLQSQTQ